MAHDEDELVDQSMVQATECETTSMSESECKNVSL